MATFAIKCSSLADGFKYTIANVSSMYYMYTQITPAGYTFGIWGVIYICQIAWLVYGWTFLCRKTAVNTISPFTYVACAVVNLNTRTLYILIYILALLRGYCVPIDTVHFVDVKRPKCIVSMVYPVVIWALTGAVVAHWGKESNRQNPIITVVLLAASIFYYSW